MGKFKLAMMVLLGLFVVSTLEHKYFDKKLSRYKKKIHNQAKFLKHMATRYPLKSGRTESHLCLPEEFTHLPISNNDIILNVTKVDIRNVLAPYNASLIENGNGYLIFFRYDIVKQMYLSFFNSYIGCAELNKEFKQTDKEFVTLNMQSDFCEDPRAIRHNGNIELIYNNLNSAKFNSRAMHIAEVDLTKHAASKINKIDLHLSKVEKNWAPFVYKREDGVEDVLFEYQVLGPRQILKYSSSGQPAWIEDQTAKELNRWCSNWSEKWGHPLGGTGARLIDGEYLSFFHSKFKAKEDGLFWYVMGAYTFEAKPPFRITRVSMQPLLFDGIYDSPALNTAEPDKFVIFPTGFAIEKKEDKTLIHLSCGENDSAIKIVSIDKEALVKSLQKIHYDCSD